MARESEPLDVSTVPFEERRTQVDRVIPGLIAAIVEWERDLAGMEPPPEVRDYHLALEEQAVGARLALERALDGYAAATNMREYEATNAELSMAFAELAKPVKAAESALPTDALAALQGISRCGDLSSD